MWIKRRKTLLSTFWTLNGLSSEQTWIVFTQGCFAQIWLKLAKWFSGRLLNFVIISTWKRTGPFTKLNSLHPGIICVKLVEISQVVMKKKILKFCKCIFAISYLSLLENRCGPSFQQTWIPFTKGCFGISLIEIS